MFDNNRLQKFRKKIDQIDDEIFDLLQERFFYASKIGKIKEKKDIPIQNRKRETEIIQEKLTQYANTELSNSFIKQLLSLIFKESRRIQRTFDK